MHRLNGHGRLTLAPSLARIARELTPINAWLERRDPTQWLDRAGAQPLPPRIGVLTVGDWLRELISCCGEEADWFALEPGHEPLDAARREFLDAVIAADTQSLTISFCEHPGREAGWHDWSHERTLAHEHVFPARIDLARIELPLPCSTWDRRLLARLLLAGCELSRISPRTSPFDTIAGRRIAPSMSDRPDRAMLALAAGLASEDLEASPVASAASHAVSAWLCTGSTGMDATSRRIACEEAARFATGQPHVLLRLAAAHIADCDDSTGIELLLDADRTLRSGVIVPSGTLALYAELESPGFDSMALGRLCAGITLACATTELDRIGALRDDLLDDASHHDFFRERTQDLFLIERVFRALVHARSLNRFCGTRAA